MRLSCRAPMSVATIVLSLALSTVWMAGSQEAGRQPGATAVPAREAGRAQSSLDQRRTALERQEQRRLEALKDLEFFPGPGRFPPGGFPHLCFFPPPTPPAAIDPHRSLFVHDRATLDAADFSLQRTFTQFASQLAMLTPPITTDAIKIFRQLWDTQNAPQCSGTLNGFPINCPRAEGQEAIGSDADVKLRMEEYKVLALVNRLDLAHQGWRNCGEHRIVYGKAAGGKNFIIFEAVLPNPRPGCREGCVPVAEFWRSLSAIDDPKTRAQKLEDFFFTGKALPGFRPVVHVNHYSANGVSTGYGSSGSGQIRTNQFLQSPWILKEFKTLIDCGVTPCTFQIVPIMVKVNPHGTLWNEDNADARAIDFRGDTLAQTVRLSSSAMNGIGYEVDLANDAGQSMSSFGPGFVDNYTAQMNSAIAVTFRAALATGVLTADQMSNRALTQSCAGCHMPSMFGLTAPNSIGTVTTPVGSASPTIDNWPDVVSTGFAHVNTFPASVRPELAANPAAFGTGMGQEISPALIDFFLPDRKNFLLGELNKPRCLCIPRFRFLDVAVRRRAFDIEARVEKQFGPKLEALERKLTEARAMRGREASAELEKEKAQLVAEREKTIATELASAGIKLPDAELQDLRPQTMKLRAASLSQGDARRAATLRIEEVNRLLRADPPRRTVTGSFRPH